MSARDYAAVAAILLGTYAAVILYATVILAVVKAVHG